MRLNISHQFSCHLYIKYIQKSLKYVNQQTNLEKVWNEVICVTFHFHCIWSPFGKLSVILRDHWKKRRWNNWVDSILNLTGASKITTALKLHVAAPKIVKYSRSRDSEENIFVVRDLIKTYTQSRGDFSPLHPSPTHGASIFDWQPALSAIKPNVGIWYRIIVIVPPMTHSKQSSLAVVLGLFDLVLFLKIKSPIAQRIVIQIQNCLQHLNPCHREHNMSLGVNSGL